MPASDNQMSADNRTQPASVTPAPVSEPGIEETITPATTGEPVAQEPLDEDEDDESFTNDMPSPSAPAA